VSQRAGRVGGLLAAALLVFFGRGGRTCRGRSRSVRRIPRDGPRGDPSLPDVTAGRYFSETADGGAIVTNLGDALLGIGVARFAPGERSRRAGSLPAGATARIAIPRDTATVPWRVVTSGRSSLQVCPL
jgi:hypothetical protein